MRVRMHVFMHAFVWRGVERTCPTPPGAPLPLPEPNSNPPRVCTTQRELNTRNAQIQARLVDTYRHNPDSFLERNNLGRGFDCNERCIKVLRGLLSLSLLCPTLYLHYVYYAPIMVLGEGALHSPD
jgi:hypothetical protein